MPALNNVILTPIFCGNYAAADAKTKELSALADEKAAPYWKACGMMHEGCVLALSGNPSGAVQMITSSIAAFRSTGATLWTPLHFSYLAKSNADLGQFDDAWRCIGEAISTIEATKERWFEAETNRIAGEIALKSLQPDTAKAEGYFERALAVARQSRRAASPRLNWL
jgi:predicted ATPase